jgi:predicted acylesterase/phospholipase RssA
MPNGADAARLARLRDLAVVGLKQTSLFQNASWRLLSDFVDDVGTVRLVEGGLNLEKLQLLIVLDGKVQVGRPPAGPKAMFDPGIYLSFPGAPFGDDELRIEQHPSGAAAVFSISKPDWKKLGRSFDLTRSLTLSGTSPAIKAELVGMTTSNKIEVNWVVLSDEIAQVSAQPGQIASLLLHLLAAGVSRVVPSDRIFAVEMLPGNQFRLEIWQGGHLAGAPVEGTDLGAAMAAAGPGAGAQLPRRLFLCWSHRLPPRETAADKASWQRFVHAVDRVIYLHAGEVARFPAEQLFAGVPVGALHTGPATGGPGEALARGSYASRLSVSLRTADRPVATEALPVAAAPETLGAELRRSLGRAVESTLVVSTLGFLGRRRHFQTRPLLDSAGSPAGKSTRVERDAVRLELVVPRLLERRQHFEASGGRPSDFAESLFQADASFTDQADQLGRAVTCKRVGIAVSGGGASAFRIGPLLELIGSGQEQVAVDFFAGVSGGALVGAYYCALGTAGISRLLAESERLQWVLPVLSVSTWPLEAWIDTNLGGKRVEDLMRPVYLPVATELAGEAAPRAVVITAGTLGEAVRASGSLPLGFGPTQKNGKRYADGAAAALIPKTMLDDRADVILGCDAVPGPRHSNPWFDSPPAVLVHDYTPLGRVIDVWTWSAFMMQNASRSAAYGADVFLAFEPDRIPMRDTLEWGRATQIVADARADKETAKAAHDLYQAYDKAGTSVPNPSKPPLPGGP